MWRRTSIAILSTLLSLALFASAALAAKDCTHTQTGLVPLTDFSGLYLGQFQGGLYENGSNTIPPDHLAAGLAAASNVVSRNGVGAPDPAGRVVLLSIGMSNTRMEYCGDTDPCLVPSAYSFMTQAAADPGVNHTSLRILNGAWSGQGADSSWRNATGQNYNRVRDYILTPSGVTEAQVQVIWLKEAEGRFNGLLLPDPNADAYILLRDLGLIVRAAKVRYPNLRLVYLSSRIYSGYAPPPIPGEPRAYESGFAVKWLIAAQINQLRTGQIDSRAGDLSLAVAPWLAWGPYLWADGLVPRSDGLVWACGDYKSDGGHPGPGAVQKVGAMLLGFLRAEPTTTGWFR